MPLTDESYEGWAIVELFGHRVIPCYVRPVSMYGETMAHVDTRDTLDPPIVQSYGGKAIYCITPTSEENVRRVNLPYGHLSALVAARDAEIVEDGGGVHDCELDAFLDEVEQRDGLAGDS